MDEFIIIIAGGVITFSIFKILVLLSKYLQEKKSEEIPNNHKCMKCGSENDLNNTFFKGHHIFLCTKCVKYLLNFDKISLDDIKQFEKKVYENLEKQNKGE